LPLEGSLSANGGRPVEAGEFILFKNDGDEAVVESEGRTKALFLSGAPIEEPLVHYGPFVMNTVDEINQAIEDFNSGKFGYLE
jgi:redox-sensitive bicupin YhaK (pirin superfamily)